MRGLEGDMNVKSEDIAFLLDGHIPNKYKVDKTNKSIKHQLPITSIFFILCDIYLLGVSPSA